MVVVPLPKTSFHGENCPVNDRVWRVVKELQYRQGVLINIKSQELRWKLIFLAACGVSMFGIFARNYAPLWKPLFPMWLLLIFLLGDCTIFLRLHRVQTKLQKALVNFGVIRHHLIGIVEVGLCACNSVCDCKEKFKSQVLHDFGVSLY